MQWINMRMKILFVSVKLMSHGHMRNMTTESDAFQEK